MEKITFTGLISLFFILINCERIRYSFNQMTCHYTRVIKCKNNLS